MPEAISTLFRQAGDRYILQDALTVLGKKMERAGVDLERTLQKSCAAFAQHLRVNVTLGDRVLRYAFAHASWDKAHRQVMVRIVDAQADEMMRSFASPGTVVYHVGVTAVPAFVVFHGVSYEVAYPQVYVEVRAPMPSQVPGDVPHAGHPATRYTLNIIEKGAIFAVNTLPPGNAFVKQITHALEREYGSGQSYEVVQE